MAGPGSVRGSSQAAASPPSAEGDVAREETGTGCAGKMRDPSMARTVAVMRARSDALHKVCGGGRQAGSVSGRVSGGIERYFVDEASGQMCATGTFQVACEPEPPAAPAGQAPSLSVQSRPAPLPQRPLPDAQRATPVAARPPDTAAIERELEDDGRVARRAIEDVGRGNTSPDDVRRRADAALGELDDL